MRNEFVRIKQRISDAARLASKIYRITLNLLSNAIVMNTNTFPGSPTILKIAWRTAIIWWKDMPDLRIKRLKYTLQESMTFWGTSAMMRNLCNSKKYASKLHPGSRIYAERFENKWGEKLYYLCLNACHICAEPSNNFTKENNKLFLNNSNFQKQWIVHLKCWSSSAATRDWSRF